MTDTETSDETTDVKDADTSDQPEDMTDAETSDEATDVEDTDTTDQPEDRSEAETSDEATDVEDTDTTDQPEDMTDAETSDEATDVEDTDTTDQPEDRSEAETSDEATDVENANTVDQPEDRSEAETSDEATNIDDAENVEKPNHTFKDWVDPQNYDADGHYVGDGQDWGYHPEGMQHSEYSQKIDEQAENIWKDHQDYMDNNNGDVRDRLSNGDAPERADYLITNADVAEGSGDTTEIKSISDYMNAHNYGPDDFATYSQDPQWRQLMRQEYPDYDLPEMSQESASAQLSQYMNDHNYGADDYAEYSQDPTWRELHSNAFPNDELPSLESQEYSSIVNTLNDMNVAYRPVEFADESRTVGDIINDLGGGDLTEGSCSSLAFAYAGNKAGYDVLDFRDGDSREFFSSNDSIQAIANLPGVESKTVWGTDDIQCADSLLSEMEEGKEYYLATGQHASIVRKAGEGYEFLELQSATNNGWRALDNNVLEHRFGCDSYNQDQYPNFLIDIDSLGNKPEFRNILGYINTAESSQVKGGAGHVR